MKSTSCRHVRARVVSRRVQLSISGTDLFFNGVFTPMFRELLRDKRSQLGATMPQLARLLQVDVSTLRKWECGKVRSCSIIHARRLAEFLNGAHDQRLKMLNVDFRHIARQWLELPKAISSRIEQALAIYRLCDRHPDLQDQMLAGFDGAMSGTVQNLLRRSLSEGAAPDGCAQANLPRG